MKTFPCWVCKGQGGEKQQICDDGSGPYDECGYCEGKGLIEVGGKVHKRIRAFDIGIKILSFYKPYPEDGWSYEEILSIGMKALNLFKKAV